MMRVLLLALIALAFADYPLDFDSTAGRAVGDDLWLHPWNGPYTADISGRNLTGSFVEFTYFPLKGQTCDYSIWLDGAKVSSGTFRNNVPTTIPTKSDSFPVGTEEITVHVKGCYLGRYAVPFSLGWNGASVYLHDITPKTLADVGSAIGFDFSTRPGYAGFNTPQNYEQYNAQFQYWGTSFWDNTAAFSSQVNDIDAGSTFWYTTEGVFFDWSDVDPLNNGAEFLIDLVHWTKTDNLYWYLYACTIATATNACQDITDYNDQTYYSETTYQTSENPRMLNTYFYSGTVPKNTPLHFKHLYSYIDDNDYTTAGFEQAAFAYIYSFGVLGPYAKFWNLDTAANSDPNHIIVDLRNLDGGDCVYTRYTYDPATTNFAFEAETFGQLNEVTGVSQNLYYTSVADRSQFGLITCPNDDSGLISTPPVALAGCTAFNAIGTNANTVATSAATVTGLAMPDGAILELPIYDTGLKTMQTGVCLNLPPLSQSSWFDIDFGGVAIGSAGQGHIVNNFVGRVALQGTNAWFHLDTSVANPDFTFTSRPGLSIDLNPFLFVHGLSPAACNATNCFNNGVCADPFVSANCQPAPADGGPAAANTNVNAPGAWTGLWYGALNDLPVPYCNPTTCLNGGTCVENPLRTWDALLYGTGGVDNATYCDCAGTNTSATSGDYWGQSCEFAPPCDANPCLNGGLCINQGGSVFSCDCTTTISPYTTATHYSGARCEVSGTTPCDLSPCRNGGTCSLSASGSYGYSCNCAGGWSGHSCGIPPVDACLADLNVCGEFGKCAPSFDVSQGYIQCICLYGYTGALCDTPPAKCSTDFSQSWQKRDAQDTTAFNAEYCLNGGACISTNDAASDIVACLCRDPWVGSRCQWNATQFAGASAFGANMFVVLLLSVVALLI